jgi:hypothetical protein
MPKQPERREEVTEPQEEDLGERCNDELNDKVERAIIGKKVVLIEVPKEVRQG